MVAARIHAVRPVLFALWLGGAVAGCPLAGIAQPGGAGAPGMVSSGEAVERALERHQQAIMTLPGVVGTGLSICDGQPCIKVFVLQGTSGIEPALVRILGDHPFVVEATGPMRARPLSD